MQCGRAWRKFGIPADEPVDRTFSFESETRREANLLLSGIEARLSDQWHAILSPSCRGLRQRAKNQLQNKKQTIEKHDAGQGIGWGARRGGMDATARGGARISASPRFSGLWFRPGKRKATARLKTHNSFCFFFLPLILPRWTQARRVRRERDCANNACKEERASERASKRKTRNTSSGSHTASQFCRHDTQHDTTRWTKHVHGTYDTRSFRWCS